MASSFLVLSLIAALLSVAAVTRLAPTGRLGLGWFFLSFPAFHFAGAMLLAGVAITLVAVLLGALQSPAGRAALIPDAIAFAALLLVRRRSSATQGELERALQTALGNDSIRLSSAAPPIDSLNPLKLRQPGVERVADLSYGDAGMRNLLDLYRPASLAAGRALPILLWIHGGAWVTGNKTQQGLPLMYGMARLGWLTVGINYRLAPGSRFPDLLVDVKKAIAWLRTHAAEYGGDPKFIIAAGGSAGGHLAALAALTPNRPEYQPGFEGADTTLAAAIPLYGRFDFIDRSKALGGGRFLIDFLGKYVMPKRYQDDPAIWDEASPIAQVGPHSPPMFVVHGTHDSLIPIAEAAAFVGALREASRQPVAFASLHGAQHAWDLLNTPWTRHTVAAVHAFSEYVYAQDRLGAELT